MLNKIRYKVIQSQVISASSCERNWSAHGHIHTKLCNRLDPATTEKLVYVYSNITLVASTRDADKLKMFSWDIEDVELLHCLLVASGWTGPDPRRRGAEAQSCSFRREARGASRVSAPLRASANHSPSALREPPASSLARSRRPGGQTLCICWQLWPNLAPRRAPPSRRASPGLHGRGPAKFPARELRHPQEMEADCRRRCSLSGLHLPRMSAQVRT